jgi:hypothetical protein
MSIETNSDLSSVLISCSMYSFQLVDDMPQDVVESGWYSSERSEPEPFQLIVESSASASDSGSDSDSRSFDYDPQDVLKCRKIDRIGAVIKAYQTLVQSVSDDGLCCEFEEKRPLKTICFPRTLQCSPKRLPFFFTQLVEARQAVLLRSTAFRIEYMQPQYVCR